jgi:hypothetical protein
MLGFLVSRGVANPIMAHIQETQPESFPLTKRARKQGVEALRRETYRVQFDASVGRAPPLSDGELHVRSAAVHTGPPLALPSVLSAPAFRGWFWYGNC